MVCATLIPFRADTEPRPNLEQLPFPVMLTAFVSACTEDWAAADGRAAQMLAKPIRASLDISFDFIVFSCLAFVATSYADRPHGTHRNLQFQVPWPTVHKQRRWVAVNEA